MINDVDTIFIQLDNNEVLILSKDYKAIIHSLDITINYHIVNKHFVHTNEVRKI